MPTYSKVKEVKNEARKLERNRAQTIAVTSILAIVALTAAITATILTVTGGNRNRPDEEVSTAIVFQLPVAEFQGILKNSSFSEPQFNETMNRWEGHTGIAIASPLGAAVLATYNGTVTSVRNHTLYGKQIIIQHPNGLRTVLSNLDENTTTVTEGQRVERGQKIGTIGQTRAIEFPTTPHLHVRVYRDDRRVNPNDYIDFPEK